MLGTAGRCVVDIELPDRSSFMGIKDMRPVGLERVQIDIPFAIPSQGGGEESSVAFFVLR